MHFRFREPWPFCQEAINVGSVVNPSFFPILTNYAKAFKWCWRVRKWRASVNITYTIDDRPIPGETTNVSFAGSIDISQSDRDTAIPVTEERELGCDPTWHSFKDFEPMTSTWSNSLGDSGTAVEVSMGLYIAREYDNIDYGLPDLAHWMYRTGGGFLPSILVEFATLSAEAGWSGSNTLNNGYRGLGSLGSIGGNFDSLSLPFYSASDGVSSLSGSISIAPEEWWAYDPEDGLGPIYSTSTGTALRDPFSV